MATTIVFATPDDAYVMCEDTVYATARAGTGTLTIGSDSFSSVVGQSPPYKCREGFLNFDTSWIAGDSPLSVVLSLFLYGASTPVEIDAAVTTRTPPYTTGSFIAGASLPAAQATLAAPVLGGYNDFAEAGLLAALDHNALTYLVLYGKNQRDNVTPSGVEDISFYPTAQAGTSQDPKLTVYTPDTPGDDPGPYAVVHPPIAGERST